MLINLERRCDSLSSFNAVGDFCCDKKPIESSAFFERVLFINFLSECIEASDCPNNGTNYQCNANQCECPSPLFLDGNRCVGMLPFDS